MLSDGLQLLGASTATNFSIENGAALPGSGNIGELFYRTGAGAGLYVFNGTTWALVSAEGGGFSGDYNDLINKPTLFSGDYDDLTDKPTLFSGDYADLTNKPTLFNGTFASLTGTPTTLAGYGITDAQALDADLTAIAGLAGTSGILTKTAANTWALDTTSYLSTADTTIVRTTGDQSIAGTKTFTGNVTIGNLTVSGTTTTVNSETVNIADNILELNSNFMTGDPTEDAGIQIRRGDNGVVRFFWDEANDRFTMHDGAATPNYQSLYTTATITAGTFVGALTGNASTATALATARTINGASFDGTANISFTSDAVNEGTTNLYHTTARASAAAPVQSVFGRTGAVSLTSSDVTSALGFTPADAGDLGDYLPLAGGVITGDLGIGVTPGFKLDVNGTGRVTELLLSNGASSGSLGTTPGWFSPANGVAALSTNGAERLRIDGVGNIGVGMVPVKTLSIYGATPVLQLCNSTTGTTAGDGFQLFQSGVNTVFENQDNGYQAWYTGGSERLRIDNAGNIGIGTSPGVKLDVNGIGRVTELLLSNGASSGQMGTTPGWFSPASGVAALSTNGAERLRVDSAGNVGIGTASPTSTPASRLVVGSGSSDQGMTIYPGTAGTGSLHFSDTSTEKASIKWAASDGALRFGAGNAERLVIAADGRVYAKNIHNNAGSVTGTANQYIASGTYTPTLTAGTNISSTVSRQASWIRVGNVVTVAGQFEAVATASGDSTIDLSLPIASNFTTAYQAGGTANDYSSNNYSAAFDADTTNDRVVVRWRTQTGTTTGRFSYSFSYEIV